MKLGHVCLNFKAKRFESSGNAWCFVLGPKRQVEATSFQIWLNECNMGAISIVQWFNHDKEVCFYGHHLSFSPFLNHFQ